MKRWSLNIINKKNVEESNSYLVNSHSIRAHDKDINTLACAPNDSIVVSGSQDKLIKIWNAVDLTLVATLTGHKRGIWKVVFSPVDKCLLSSSADKSLRLWSLQDFTCIRTFQGHVASVLCCKFINKGMQILSGGADGTMKLWTIRTGECENTFENNHTDRIWCIATSKEENLINGKRICFTGSSDGSLLQWIDTTLEVENELLKENELNYLMEQSLQNDLRNKKYDKVSFLLLKVYFIIFIYYCKYAAYSLTSS